MNVGVGRVAGTWRNGDSPEEPAIVASRRVSSTQRGRKENYMDDVYRIRTDVGLSCAMQVGLFPFYLFYIIIIINAK